MYNWVHGEKTLNALTRVKNYDYGILAFTAFLACVFAWPLMIILGIIENTTNLEVAIDYKVSFVISFLLLMIIPEE